MTCRNCGTEIADKALVCYRCGTATTEPVHAPPAQPRGARRSTLIVSLAAIVLMVLAAAFVTRASPDSMPRSLTLIVAGVAVVIVVLRAYARRR